MNTTTLGTLSNYDQDFTASILTYQPGQLSPDASISFAATQIFMIQMQLILTYQPIAIDGKDPEGVHKLRVGLRRLRTALRLFKPFLHPDYYAEIKSRSKQFASQLGSMRDLDVFKIHYFNHFQNTNNNLPYEEDWESTFQAFYNHSRENVVTLLQSNAFNNLIAQIYRVYQDPESCFVQQDSSSTLPQSIEDYIPLKIAKIFKQVQSYHGKLTPKSDYSIFHALRLVIKNFRYMLEFFPEILNTKATLKIIQLLIRIQDHLGDLNDCVVAGKLLTRQKSKVELWPETMRVYQSYREKQFKKLISGFFPLWKKFNRRYNLKIIKKQIADLEA